MPRNQQQEASKNGIKADKLTDTNNNTNHIWKLAKSE